MDDFYNHWETKFIIDKYNDIRPWSTRFMSERFLFEKIFRPGMSVLDVGCATGELYHALKERFCDADYTGIDVSEPLIKRARELAPNVEFVLGNILTVHDVVPKSRFDIVIATGVLQHEPRYRELINSMLEHTKEGGHALFDIKLFHTHQTLCDIERAYGDHGNHKVYYIILNFNEFTDLLNDCAGIGEIVEMYGYYAGVNTTVRLPSTIGEEVCSAHVLVQKTNHIARKKIRYNLMLPDGFKI